MKTLILLFLSVTAFSQEITYADVCNMQKSTMATFSSYTAKNGEVFKVGDRIKIGHPSNGLFFNHIDQGDGVMTAMTAAGSGAAGEEIEIKKISIFGTRKFGFKALIRTRGGLVGYGISIENALETGEVVSSIMTSDQALSELKKAKDKLDLELISQAEYDSIKIELARLIK